ncbi:MULTISPECIES: GFA family protein [unclassified Leisingera]|nr:aldehyde-activating protein [Leisingera sp. ANG-DT]KIC23452.1 aldehyde-activating protein [Leisingera sp. ANG-S3]KIC30933.1 aldehyde-activating protein [Leisingera sp. ANG-M6]KIC54933.1 aldehyde-activating protein [Leisingera sp. ANG-S]KID08630.1 aldehyde-activating protein [Leisingera sp. ANG1]
METYSGTCHCGAVRFTFRTREISSAMLCDCSICSRRGAGLTPETIPPADMHITAAPGTLKTYQFGTKTAQHHFCGTCGIHTFVETRLNPGHYRVNLGCIKGLDALRLPSEIYDGQNL